MANPWSGPGSRRSSVKCFSMTQAPLPTAAAGMAILRVWSEKPTGRPKAAVIVSIMRRLTC